MDEELLSRQQPQSLEAEQAVLGSILIDSRCITDVVGIVKPEDFYLQQNREIYEAIYTMFNFSQTIDPVTVLDKLEEEVAELRRAVENGGDVPDELGDVLFAAVKVGRFCGCDPEDAVNGTCEKFIHRFRAVEEGAAVRGREVSQLSLEEMTALWDEAKRS